MLVQDILFLISILLASTALILFLYKAVRAGYRKAMIEHMQNLSDSSRMRYDVEDEFMNWNENGNGNEYGNGSEYGNGNEREKSKWVSTPVNTEKQIQKPSIGFHKVHMLAPNTAQYGRDYVVHVPSIAGIPMSAFPNIDMKNPWSLADIEAAEVPEKEGCRKSATGLFHECGVAPANLCS